MALFEKLEFDVEINAPASMFFEMFYLRPFLIPNISSYKIQNCKLESGEWGKVGSVLHCSYFHDGKACVAKKLIEAIDEKNNLITFKMVAGDKSEYYKNFKCTIRSRRKDTGSVVHWTFEYEKLHDKILDNLHHSLMQFCVALSKDIDAHLTEIEGYKDPFVTAVAGQV